MPTPNAQVPPGRSGEPPTGPLPPAQGQAAPAAHVKPGLFWAKSGYLGRIELGDEHIDNVLIDEVPAEDVDRQIACPGHPANALGRTTQTDERLRHLPLGRGVKECQRFAGVDVASRRDG